MNGFRGRRTRDFETLGLVSTSTACSFLTSTSAGACACFNREKISSSLLSKKEAGRSPDPITLVVNGFRGRRTRDSATLGLVSTSTACSFLTSIKVSIKVEASLFFKSFPNCFKLASPSGS